MVSTRGRTVLHAAGFALTRLIELALVVLGLAFNVNENPVGGLPYLLAWDLTAIVYLAVGTVVVRRSRLHQERPDAGLPRWLAVGYAYRLHFVFTLVASLTGLGAALTVTEGSTPGETGKIIEVLGVLAVLCAWLLVHSGYAHFYRGLYYRSRESGGMSFPHCRDPGAVEFLYFAFTLGVSFAVSDVEVTSRPMRWHVLVHAVVSFFYNAAVLAVAIGILTGR